MPEIRIYTDCGKLVTTFSEIEAWHVLAASCPMNQKGSSAIAWLRRGLRDAEELQAGRDPERPSEKVMRLIAEQEER